MAITIVGTTQAGANINGNNVTLTFDGTPAEDDLVVLVGGSADSNGNNAVGPVTLGYTEAALYQLNDGTPITSGVWYKFLTSTPDGSVEANGGGVSQEATAYASVVLRGVDTSTPLDATIVETGPTTGQPDLSAIVTVTDGAWVVVGANLTDDNAPSVAPDGYSNLAGAAANDTRALSVGIATKEVASAGSEDPGAFVWDTEAWYGFTIAIRPAGGAGSTPGTASPGALALSATPQAPTVSGGGVVEPAALALSGSFPAATPSGPSVVEPAALALSAAPQAPTVAGGGVVEPGALALSATFPQTTVVAGGVTAVGTLALSVTLPAVTTAGGGAATVTPEALALAFNLPAASVAGGGIVEPDPLAVAASFGSVTVSGGAAVDPNVLAATFTFPSPTPEGGGVAEVQTLPLDVVLNAVTITGGGVAEPAELALVLTLPQVTILAGDTTGTWQEGAVTVVVQAGGAGSSGASGGVGLTTQSGDLKAGTQE